MRLVAMILLLMTLLFSESLDQKLILKAERNSTQLEMELTILQEYFQENSEAQRLKEKYGLTLALERLGEYRVLVIKPIRHQVLKYKLQELLKSKSSELFFMKVNEKVDTSDNETISQNSNSMGTFSSETWVSVIGLQWIALLLLSILGLLLSLYNRRAIRSLKREQVDLGRDQKEMEKQMKNLGECDV